MTKALVWAYGSNLNIAHMRTRCPTARPFAPLNLPNAVLRFRYVADVAYLRGAICPGALWEVTPDDVQTLDRYEGINATCPSRGLYEKKYLRLLIDGEQHRVLYYMMTRTGIMPPSQPYLDAIAQGYRDFNLDIRRLERALQHSHWRARKTPALRRRHARKGLQPFAVLVNNPAFMEES